MERYKILRNPKGERREAKRREDEKRRQDKRDLALLEMREANLETPIQKPAEEKLKKKSRLSLLKEWKKIKELKEKENKKVKRPPFYAGKLARTASGSPKLAVHLPPPISTAQLGMTTRSKAKLGSKININTVTKRELPKPLKQLNRMDGSCQKPVQNHTFAVPKAVLALHGLTIPISPKITKSARKSVKPITQNKDVPLIEETKNTRNVRKNLECLMLSQEPITMDLKKETVEHQEVATVQPFPRSVENPKSNQSEFVMKYSPTFNDLPVGKFEHLDFSPFVEKSRGKLRKSSIIKRRSIQQEIDNAEKEENSRVKGFRLFLSNETTRLLGLSENWHNYQQEIPELPADVVGEIAAVVGKTKLLTSDKFKQFQGLIDKCEAGDPQIKVDDLQGFCDWVSLEIEDLDKVFFQLEERKNRGWERAVEETKKPVFAKKPAVKKPVKKVEASSNMRQLIMARRQKMEAERKAMEQAANDMEVAMPSAAQVVKPLTPSPKRMLTPRPVSTPRDSLRVQVLQKSGLEIMMATARARLSMSPDFQIPYDNDVIPNVKPICTPGRSILKATPASSVKKSVKMMLDPIYLQPNENFTPDSSPEVLQLIEDSFTTPRRSSRLAHKTSEKKSYRV